MIHLSILGDFVLREFWLFCVQGKRPSKKIKRGNVNKGGLPSLADPRLQHSGGGLLQVFLTIGNRLIRVLSEKVKVQSFSGSFERPLSTRKQTLG